MQQQNPTINYQQQLQPHSFQHLLTIAVLCIIGAGAVLLAYYVLVNKCCCSSLPFNLTSTGWFLTSSRASTAAAGRPAADDSFIALSPGNWPRGGLDELTIQALPTREYRRGGVLECGGIYGCVVCLNEFKEQDILRVLPNCAHAFHLPCIDLWLQSNAICPLCRTSITSGQLAAGHNHHHHLQVVAPSSSPRGSQQQAESIMGSDEDFVVIELGGDVEGRAAVSEAPPPPAPRRRFGSQSPKVIGKWKQRKCGGRHLSMMGDEGIDYVRLGKDGEGDDDDQFSVQPLRRSFSWDSAADRHLLYSVRALVIRQSSSSSRARTEGRCFFRLAKSQGPAETTR